MSIATSGLGRRNRYTQAWLDSSPSYPDSANRESTYEGDSDGLAAHLYHQCRDALRDLCSQVEKEQSVFLKEELAKLYLWGQNYGHGELDAALEYSDDTLCAVLHALGNLGHALLEEFSHWYLPGVEPPHNDRRAQELKHLIEQARAVTCGIDDEHEEAGGDDSSDSDESSIYDEEEYRDITLKIRSQIRHLVDLGPTVQQNHLYAQRSRVGKTFPPIVPFHLSGPAKIYASLIREKYKNAQDQLVDRLGECNWQRHRAIRETTETSNDHRQEKATLEAGVNPITEGIEGPYSAFRPYSAFHDSGLGTSAAAQTHYAQSHISFQSSNNESTQGSLRVPPTPAEVGMAKAFQCPICGSILTNIRNRIEWKIHIFADLQPYICTFASCDKELAQFSTRAAWAEHEFTEHRIDRSWNCPECSKCCDSEAEWERHLAQSHERKFLGPQYYLAKHMACVTRVKPVENEECPLCQVVLGKPRREFVKHVGRHMEEIALIVLPRENDEDSEASSVSGSTSCPPSPDGGHGNIDLPAPTGIPGSKSDHERGSYSSGNLRALSPAVVAKAAVRFKPNHSSAMQSPMLSEIPAALSFIFRVEPLRPNYEAQPRRQSQAGSWAPPDRQNGYTSSPGTFWRWQGGRVTALQPSDPSLRAGLHKHSVGSLFSQYPNTPHILVIPFDVRTRNARDYPGGWLPITFDHKRLGDAENTREYYSSVSALGDSDHLAAPGQAFWMPQLLPLWYNYRAAANAARRTHIGLIGHLPILLALAVFSAPETNLLEAMNSIQPNSWRPHKHQYPSGHLSSERGMVVSVFMDPLNPEYSTKDLLDKLTNGDFGPFYGRRPATYDPRILQREVKSSSAEREDNEER